MSLTHTTAVRNAIADLIDSSINTGSGTATLKIYTTGFGTELASFNLPNPAFDAAGTGGAGIIQSNAISDATAGNTGTAATFKIFDRDGTEIVQGSCGASGSGEDIELSNVSINTSDTLSVALNAITWTAPT